MEYSVVDCGTHFVVVNRYGRAVAKLFHLGQAHERAHELRALYALRNNASK